MKLTPKDFEGMDLEPIKPVKTKLSLTSYKRLVKLMKHCTTMSSEGEIRIFPGSKTFGGKPVPGLTSEIQMLLYGMKPSERCKDVK